MSSAIPPVPPLPAQPAAQAARESARGEGDGYDPATDPDDTGVPSPAGSDAAAIGRGFLRALFDVSFRTFITRRLASVFYVVGLIVIAIGFLVYFIGGIVRGASALGYNPGAGVSLIVATLVLVPLFSFLAVVVLRFLIEAVVALIAIAENTERTAENTRR